MDKKETIGLIELLKGFYPNSRSYDSPNVATAWAIGLEKYPIGAIQRAIMAAIEAGRWRDFPPSFPDVVHAYLDTLPRLPIDYEGLADKSGVKQAIDARVNKRFPEIDTKRQFRDIEAYNDAVAINKAQRTKYTTELYKEVKPKIQALMNSGLGTTKIIAEVFGLECVRPTQKGYLGQGPKQIEDLASQLAKKLPGGA